MPWDYKRDFMFVANVVKMQHTFYFLVGGTLNSEFKRCMTIIMLRL